MTIREAITKVENLVCAGKATEEYLHCVEFLENQKSLSVDLFSYIAWWNAWRITMAERPNGILVDGDEEWKCEEDPSGDFLYCQELGSKHCCGTLFFRTSETSVFICVPYGEKKHILTREHVNMHFDFFVSLAGLLEEKEKSGRYV